MSKVRSLPRLPKASDLRKQGGTDRRIGKHDGQAELMRCTVAAMTTPPLLTRVDRFERHLRSENKSDNTINVYGSAARKLADWLIGQGITDWADVTRDEISDFIADLLDGGAAPGYANNIYRSLKAFFRYWCDVTDKPDPMAKLKPPKVPEQTVPIVPMDKLTALIKSCQGKAFVPRRDMAIITMFMDLGLRRHELTGLNVDDIDLRDGVVHVRKEIAKNRTSRYVSYGADTAKIIDQYLDARDLHPQHHLPNLWLGEKGKGPMTDSGVYQMIERRGKAVDIEKLYPHRLRHTWVHLMKTANMSPDEIMAAAGWKSQQMLVRYAASTASERARATMRRASPVDRLKRGELR